VGRSILTDGYSGRTQRVNTKNQAEVAAVTLTQEEEALREGVFFNLNTEAITLTSSNTSAVFYLKNNETRDLILKALFYIVGSSTGGAGDTTWVGYLNPTSGTIIDNATAVGINANRNAGSSRELEADVYKGAEGYTISGGYKILSSRINQPAVRVTEALRAILNPIEVLLLIPKKKSFALTYTPATGNTNVNIEVAAATYLI
jgi:hypothetical protein